MPNEIRITRNQTGKYDVVVFMDDKTGTMTAEYHEIIEKVDELVKMLEKTIDK